MANNLGANFVSLSNKSTGLKSGLDRPDQTSLAGIEFSWRFAAAHAHATAWQTDLLRAKMTLRNRTDLKLAFEVGIAGLKVKTTPL